MWRRVREGVDVLGFVVRVDLVAFVLTLGTVGEETGTAGVNVGGRLAGLCAALDAFEDGLYRWEVVRRGGVEDNIAGNGLFGDDFTVG